MSSFTGNDNYPYVSRENWQTRGWLLVRKLRLYKTASANDRRVAALLCRKSEFMRTSPYLAPLLEEIAYGDPSSIYGTTSGPTTT